jgi:hypothetical protein
MDRVGFLKVTRQADVDGKRMWKIQSVPTMLLDDDGLPVLDENGDPVWGHWAYMTRIVDNQYVNRIPVGIFHVPLELTLKEK